MDSEDETLKPFEAAAVELVKICPLPEPTEAAFRLQGMADDAIARWNDGRDVMEVSIVTIAAAIACIAGARQGAQRAEHAIRQELPATIAGVMFAAGVDSVRVDKSALDKMAESGLKLVGTAEEDAITFELVPTDRPKIEIVR